MKNRSWNLGMCAALAIAGHWCTSAWAEDGATVTRTFQGVVSDSLLYSLVQDDSVLDAVDRTGEQGLQAKGEVRLTEQGDLQELQLETAGLRISIVAGENQAGDMIANSTDRDMRLDLTDMVFSSSGDWFTLEAQIAEEGVSIAVEASLDQPSEDPPAEAAAPAAPGIDIAVSRVGLTSSGTGSDNFNYYGAADGIRSYSMASTSCNVGTEVAEWISGSSARHPVIAQNMFRLHDGKFEQVGQSWLKHSFCAVSEGTCGNCQSTPCSTLGLGCADTYGAGLNDGANGGPKWQINPQGLGIVDGHAATHTHPYPSPTGPSAIRGRLQIHESDILAGGQFFAEIQYITHDEPLFNRHNNASWREVNVSLTSISGVQSGQASVHFEQPAVFAWTEIEGAIVKSVDVLGEGRYHVGYQATDNGDGTWHYEYVVHNMNSDRCAGSFSVPVPAGVTVSNIDFHDVDYHSGEPYDGTDWTAELAGGLLTWSTQTFEENELANALRWGTAYNFRFDANSPPMQEQASIGLFKPGLPESINATIDAPEPVDLGCPADLDDSGSVDAADLALLLGSWGPNPGSSADLNGDGLVDAADLALLLGGWGLCPG